MPKPTLHRTRNPDGAESINEPHTGSAGNGASDERLPPVPEVFSERLTRPVLAMGPAREVGTARSLSPGRDDVDLRRALRDAMDALQEAECERDALWEENSGLRNEIIALRQTVALTQHIQEHARAMEATRGWRLLLLFRRFRQAILRR